MRGQGQGSRPGSRHPGRALPGRAPRPARPWPDALRCAPAYRSRARAAAAVPARGGHGRRGRGRALQPSNSIRAPARSRPAPTSPSCPAARSPRAPCSSATPASGLRPGDRRGARDRAHPPPRRALRCPRLPRAAPLRRAAPAPPPGRDPGRQRQARAGPHPRPPLHRVRLRAYVVTVPDCLGPKADLNDLLRELGVSAVRMAVEDAERIEASSAARAAPSTARAGQRHRDRAPGARAPRRAVRPGGGRRRCDLALRPHPLGADRRGPARAPDPQGGRGGLPRRRRQAAGRCG